MATRCSILAWNTPWTKEPASLQPMGFKESDINERVCVCVCVCVCVYTHRSSLKNSISDFSEVNYLV